MKKKVAKKRLKAVRGIRHCGKCKDGRLIELKPRSLLFCGFCGSEFRV